MHVNHTQKHKLPDGFKDASQRMALLDSGTGSRLCCQFVFWILLTLFPLNLSAQNPVPPSSAASSSAPQASGQVHLANQEIMQTNEILARLAQMRSGRKLGAYSSDYVIGPRDTLTISVFEVPELGKQVQVSNEGQISLPLLGSIQAAGLTAHEMELVIAEMLRQKYVKNPQVSVVVTEYRNQPPLLVFGAVRSPGPVQLFAPRSLIEVLAQVGGFTEDVGQWITIRRARVGQGNPNMLPSNPNPVRNPASNPGENGARDAASAQASGQPAEKSEIRIDVKDLLSYRDPNSDIFLYPGDMVDVSKAGIVYVTGDVKRPGGFVLKELSGMSIIRALALAEGVKGTAATSRAKIYRPKEDGTAEEIALNLKDVLRGKRTDLQLRGGDILFVPESGAKSFFRRSAGGAAQSIVNTLGYSIYRY